MSVKHLATGSQCPPVTDNGLMRVYSMKYCPYAQRTLIVLNAKNVNYEIVNVNMQSKPEWFLKLNPLGKVPILELYGKPMCESMITCDYLDEAHPNPSLYPADPWAKGVDKYLIELFGEKVSNPFFGIFPNHKDNEKVRSFAVEVRKGLQIFENTLTERGTKYFGGKTPGMLDFAIYPWFERFPVLHKIVPEFDGFDEVSFPKLYACMEGVKQDPAVQPTSPNFDDHVKFIISFFEKRYDYDL